MQLHIPKTFFDEPIPPRLFLCTTGKKRICELQGFNLNGKLRWVTYSEITFDIDRTYVDCLTGETVVNPNYDKIENPRLIEVEGYAYFIIQDLDDGYGEKDAKNVSAFSFEYALSQTYLDSFYVNNGETDSIEVIYESERYGEDAGPDVMYTMANSLNWDSSETYYHRVYTNAIDYTYEPVQIADEATYSLHFGEDIQTEDVLYVHGYANVKFYDPLTPELSLLHLIFKNTPMWTIGNVDYSLRNKERKIEIERENIYNVLTNTVTDVFKCMCIFNSLNGTVDFYEEENDGLTESNDVNSDFETDIYISKQNLMSQCNVKYSSDDIKTKIKVNGADDLTIREVNLGKNYLLNLDYYHTLDWMEQDLFEAYDDYLDAVEEYKPLYTAAMQGWVAAYNEWDRLMNAVPAENNVLLVGDIFRKLYCLYSPIDTAYLPADASLGETVGNLYMLDDHTTVINKVVLNNNQQFVVQGYAYLYNTTNQNFTCNRNLVPENTISLIKKLNLYHVDEDLDASESDSVLLTLKNSEKDTATLRVYDSKIANTGAYDADAQYYVRNVDVGGTISYSRVMFRSAAEYNAFDVTTLYKNNYKVRLMIVRAASGVSEAPRDYDLNRWVNGELVTEDGGILSSLLNWTVKSIGNLGAYLCLAKNETQEVLEADILTHQPTDYLKSFGVNLLKSKQTTYTTLFQAQIEEMYAQDKYQCIVSSVQPAGVYPTNTKWFDMSTATLKTYSGITWIIDTTSVSPTDIANYENYQRYLDNYYKLQAVQKVLNEKEKEATYHIDGYAVEGRQINMSLYTLSGGVLRYNGQTLEGNMHRAAQQHFGNNTITRVDMDSTYPIYTFTTSAYPDKTFAVYLKGKTPYVAYADAEDVWQTKMDYYARLTNLEEFFTDDQYLRLSPFIKEDEYTNDNFLLNSLESEAERIEIYNELVEEASKELKKLAQPKLEFTINMANILALPEFTPILGQFQFGNFARVELLPGLVKKARLLEADIDFSNLANFSCGFGPMVQNKSQIDRHADLLKQAVQAGRQVAASSGTWQRAADKSDKLEQQIAGGLADVTIEVGKASGQSIELGPHGLRGRKLIDGTTDQYEDEQVALINNKLCFTADNWKTSKSNFGKYTIDGETRWGTLAEAVVAGYIQGSKIVGSEIYAGDPVGGFETSLDGSDVILNVNNNFILTRDGALTVRCVSSDNQNQVATTDALGDLQSALQYYTEITCLGSTIFNTTSSSATLTCHVYSYGVEITPDAGTMYSWTRNSNDTAADTIWNSEHANRTENSLQITNADIIGNANFSCSVNLQIDD